MKIVGIIALTLGLTMGSIGSAFAERGHDGDVLHAGKGTVCWTDWDRGGAYEQCGTIFESGDGSMSDSPSGE
tara:strand:+ start:1063 stop:1278 length:216 start_codon:yes stop_codon:yes gene_type:complete